MPLEYVNSSRGHLKLVHNHYLYIKDRVLDDKTYWRCDNCQIGKSKSAHRTNCPARLHTRNDEVTHVLCSHNHPVDESKLSLHRAFTLMRYIAIENLELTPQEVIAQIMAICDSETVKLMPQIHCLKRAIVRLRMQKTADAYSGYLMDDEDGNDENGDERLNTTEPAQVDLESSEDSSAELETNNVSYQHSNAINNTLINLYKRGETQAATTSSKCDSESLAVSVKTEVNGLKPVAVVDQSKTTVTSSHNNELSQSNWVSRLPFSGTKRKPEQQYGQVEPKRRPIVQKDVLVLEYSTTKFSDVGGCENHLLEICKMVMHLKHAEIYTKLGVKPPRGFLLHGPPGCGKTMIAHAIAGELELPFIKVAATEIISGVSGDSEQKLRDLFSQATAFAPCILFLDEIDAIAPRRDTAQREMERRIVAQLFSCLDDLEKSDKPVMVIGATSRPDSIDPGLRRAGRFDKEIGLGMPDEKTREKILEVVCRNLTVESNFNLKFLARLTPGYVGADLAALVREACVIAINRILRNVFGREDDADWKWKLSLDEAIRWLKDKSAFTYDKLDELFIRMDDFKKALKLVTPSAKREGFATVPDVSWDDVGALASARDILKWSILYPIKHPEAFDALGLSTKPQGVLLCGPPGCGKTLIAKAIANESGMNFISVKGPELLSMYVGESERAVRQVFQRAVNSSPCVIFFDELDALCPRRSDHESSGSARLVNQLLTEMDGIEGRKMVFIIGATNRPDIIDPAIMRPGRLDKVVYVGFPSIDDKIDIFRAVTKNRTKPVISADCDFKLLAADSRAEFYTGADLAALVHEAAVAALKEGAKLDSATETVADVSEPVARPVVCTRHFEAAFCVVRPSVSAKERATFEALRHKYQVLT